MPFAALNYWVGENPFAFDVTFEVENRSGQDLVVTPVGVVAESGRRTLLPLLKPGPRNEHVKQFKHFPLPAGGTIPFKYDWDDVNLADLLIHTPAGVRAFPLDPAPTKNMFRPPATKRFVITDVDSLPLADKLQLDALRWHPPFLLVYILASPLALYGFIWSGRQIDRLPPPLPSAVQAA